MPHVRYSRIYLVTAIILLMLVSVINVADKELLAPIADSVKSELGMNDTQLGMVRSSVFMAALLGQLFWGPLSDRWIRKNIIAIGAILWSALTWMTAFVVNFPQLLLARASMSFAEGCFNPSAYALITDTVAKKNHGIVLGLMSLTYPVGTAAALVVASLVGTDRWRQPFIIYGVIGLLLGVLVWIIIREPQRGASEEALSDVDGVYTGRFSLDEFRNVLHIPSLWLGFGLDTCQAAVNWSFAFWAPAYLTRYRIAPNAETAALALLPAIMGFVLGALLGGLLIDRLRKFTLLAPVWVSLAAMVGGLLMALFVFNLFSMGALMTAAFLLGLATYMVMPAVNIVLFSVVPPEAKATTISASNVLLNSATAILSLIIGIISDRYGLRVGFSGVVFVMYAIGILVSLALFQRYPKDLAQRDRIVERRIAVRS